MNDTPARVPIEPSFVPGRAVKTILGIDDPRRLARIIKVPAHYIAGDDGFCMEVKALTRIIQTRFPSRKVALAEWLAFARAARQPAFD